MVQLQDKKSFNYSIRRYWAKLLRWSRTKGFGVQAPWAYHFVTKILNDKANYSAYHEITEQIANVNKKTVRLAKLYYRLACAQPLNRWQLCTRNNHYYRPFIIEGLIRAHQYHYDIDNFVGDIVRADVLIMEITSNALAVFHQFVNQAKNDSMLVVEGISTNKHTKRVWQEMKQNTNVCVSFDLFDCGILFFDPSKTSGHYKGWF